MDDFYSAGGQPNNDADFFAGGPSGQGSDDFYNSGNSANMQSSGNPFDGQQVVDFDDSDSRHAEDFFSADGEAAGGFGGGRGGEAPGSGGVGSPEREEGDDRYPWQIGFWRNMFDVDTKEVLVRVVSSLLPFRRGFVDSIKAKPDLWAPFWICSTLIFFMTWTGNFSLYLQTVINDTHYVPQVEKLPWGALIVYGYWLVIPLVFWGIFRWKEVPIPLLVCYALFGYSLFTYIPISIVAIAALGPVQWLSWLLIMLACAVSTAQLTFSFFFLVHDEDFKPGYIMVLAMGILSIGLGLSFKLYFFVFEAPPVNGTNVNF